MTSDTLPLVALALVVFVLSMFMGRHAQADTETISTSEIMTEGLDVACMDYEVVGGCIWMTCTIYSCEFDFSIRVSHRIPETVVNAYPFLEKSPWPDSADEVEGSSFAEEGGASDEGGHANREQALKFKNTEVFGSPAVAVYHLLATDEDVTVCTPLTYPMVPYFISTQDRNWRDPVIETPWTLANLDTGVGAGSSRFAGLFPRIGFVKQTHDYKAGLVAAVRAADIVRQEWQPHVYQPLDTWYTEAQGEWPPEEDDPYLWQQLVPEVMSCRDLPDIDDTTDVDDPYEDRVNDVNGNAWQLWRTYSCCEQEGAVLIISF